MITRAKKKNRDHKEAEGQAVEEEGVLVNTARKSAEKEENNKKRK